MRDILHFILYIKNDTVFTFLTLVNSIKEGHICRPPEADSFFYLLLLLFIFLFFLPFFPEPLDMMGELFLGQKRGLKWAALGRQMQRDTDMAC